MSAPTLLTPHFAVTVYHSATHTRDTYLVPALSSTEAYWAVMGPGAVTDYAERVEEV
jgi:hypothetical protein